MSTGGPEGRLVCVGLGMMLGAHLGPRARAHIEQSDVVFVAASDPLVEQWVQEIRPDARSLQAYYAEGKSRHDTYREMVKALVDAVGEGRSVCAAFYGHPGVFAQVPHSAIKQLRAAGFEASMEPAVSAEDCLYADLGIDPGTVGCQHYEASQLLIYERILDPTAYLVLWQVALAGDRSYRTYASSAAHRQLLVERLLEDYPADHRVTIYEAATLPIRAPRCEVIPLNTLVSAELHMHSTLVIPPAGPMRRSEGMRARLDQLDTEVRHVASLAAAISA